MNSAASEEKKLERLAGGGPSARLLQVSAFHTAVSFHNCISESSFVKINDLC